MLRACSCSSFSTMSCRCEMRCIHQKQTAQQPMSSRVTKFAKVGLTAFESCLAVRLAGHNISGALRAS